MNKIFNISEKDYNNFILDFFQSFKNGFEFESFLKIYLDKIGLDEVMITRRSRDGGIDLKAKRLGIGYFSDSDVVNYYVQAKCYNPNKKISVSKIRELKGVIPSGYKGIFITTTSFTKEAMEEALNDSSRMVILIDGKKLIESCIDNEIGFVFIPKFCRENLQKFIQNDFNINENDSNLIINKKITYNDIRAKILSIPSAIYEKIPTNIDKLKIAINGDIINLKLCRSRKFISGITKIYKDLGLISDDGAFHPTMAIWKYDNNEFKVTIKRVDEENN